MSKDELNVSKEWMDRFKRAYAREAESQWELADLVLEAAPKLEEGEHYDNGQSLQTRLRYISITLKSEGIDKQPATLKKYRQAGIAFPPGSEARTQSIWPAHRLQHQPDREELVTGDKWTDTDAQEFVTIRSKRDPSATREQFREYQTAVQEEKDKRSPVKPDQLQRLFWPRDDDEDEQEEQPGPTAGLIDYGEVVKDRVKGFRSELAEFSQLINVLNEMTDDHVTQMVSASREFQKKFSMIQTTLNEEQDNRLRAKYVDKTEPEEGGEDEAAAV